MVDYDLTFGKCYHLFQKGDNQQALFRESADYFTFLDLYRKYLSPIAELYAYCLMPTHFQLLFKIKEKSEIEYVYPSDDLFGWQIKMLLTVYRWNRTGSTNTRSLLFNSGTFQQIPVEMDLLCKLVVYIHKNPQIHGVVSDYKRWPHSSCNAYLRQDRRSMISKETLLDPKFRNKLLYLQDEFTSLEPIGSQIEQG